MKTRIMTQEYSLTRGAALFLEHALALLSEAVLRSHPEDPFREPLEVGVARASAVLRLVEGRCSDLSPTEGRALAEALRVATDLASAARVDPRWDLLDLPGDPAHELRGLRDQVLHLVSTSDAPRVLAA